MYHFGPLCSGPRFPPLPVQVNYRTTGKVLKIVVLGGSPAVGTECSNMQKFFLGQQEEDNSEVRALEVVAATCACRLDVLFIRGAF